MAGWALGIAIFTFIGLYATNMWLEQCQKDTDDHNYRLGEMEEKLKEKGLI